MTFHMATGRQCVSVPVLLQYPVVVTVRFSYGQMCETQDKRGAPLSACMQHKGCFCCGLHAHDYWHL